MERINPEQARAVWQRVLEAKHRQPPMPPAPPMPPIPPQPPVSPRPPTPPRPPERPSREEVRQWLAEILALARGYRSMNAGRFTPALRRMAAEEQAHYRQLAALYYRLYGSRPEVLPGASPGKRSLAADLRDAYAAEQRLVRQWKDAAARYPAQRAQLERFARDDRRHAEQLRRMMTQNPQK